MPMAALFCMVTVLSLIGGYARALSAGEVRPTLRRQVRRRELDARTKNSRGFSINARLIISLSIAEDFSGHLSKKY
jgi:hypothetical protein